ncbi:metal-dependent hydrolase [Sulfurovum sp. bin170]|uniref:aminofutalosine deaminase family hydrolase n=1 Tax=Sulfurovum sp. bin170 TaxID=2695268 RepID=UPI0013DE973D|nr:metal-dependent hydrolase [Sulfurovum sp. bin170]NEW60030.1 metal-dependent hydrolase [Sulfurovum sp. bin170]
MTILNPNYIYIDNTFKENIAVAFDKQIEAIDTMENLRKQYPEATIKQGRRNSVLYPGFINTHVHLEFSANKTTLQYGEFMPWLNSVIANREDLVAKCDNELMLKACEEMMHSGITTFGAISSFGAELEVCMKTPQKVLFFNELIGSSASTADMLYGDFLERLDASKKCGRGIIPAIAIHSPYSVHPIVLKRAVEIAKNEKIPLSAHFLESEAEREWLEEDAGEFLEFFQKFFSTSTSVTDIAEFMESFDNTPTHFTHAVQATKEELEYLANRGHSIAHCPRSNRLLGCGRLEVEELIKLDMPFTLATDGLSSNHSLNIFDELRAALMMHHMESINRLSNLLIKSITSIPADIFHLNSGEIAIGKDADFALINLPDQPHSLDDIALQTILHTQKVDNLFILGEDIRFV